MSLDVPAVLALGIVAVLVQAAVKKLVVDELCGLFMTFGRSVVRYAARRLPSEQERWEKEWLEELAALEAQGRRLSALLWVLGYLRGAHAMRVDARAVTEGGDPLTQGDQTSVPLDPRVIASVVQRLVQKTDRSEWPSLDFSIDGYDVDDEVARSYGRFVQRVQDAQVCEPYREWRAKRPASPDADFGFVPSRPPAGWALPRQVSRPKADPDRTRRLALVVMLLLVWDVSAPLILHRGSISNLVFFTLVGCCAWVVRALIGATRRSQ